MADTGGSAGFLPAPKKPSSARGERWLGLASYLWLAAETGPDLRLADLPARPPGRLVWFILPDAAHGGVLLELIRRFGAETRDTGFLVSGPQEALAGLPHVLASPLPDRNSQSATRLVDFWRPDLIVFMGGGLHPWLIDAARRRGVPVALIDARREEMRRLRGRWWPGLARGLMERLKPILVQDEATGRLIRRLGARAADFLVVGRMEEGLGALACAEAERDVLALALNARPVWLAVSLPEGEEAAVLAGHREALQLRHRLLLILVPENPAHGDEIAARLEAEGWDVAVRSRDEEPGEEHQIYIADTEGEQGLWYRLAPVTYFGGTLSGQGVARHPFEAAVLGSAILHGPKVQDFSAAYARLASAGAARLLRGAGQIGAAVGELLAPDRAAQMAHNAWDMTSSGAEVTDQVLARLIEAMDARGGG